MPIDYYLRSGSSAVIVEIHDAGGTVLRTFSATATSPGMHRVVWNPVSGGGRRGGDGAGIAAPTEHVGQFTARLTVDGQVQTRSFRVLPDPRGARLAP